MIRESDLRDAIAECQGSRSPNADTCIKLAAYYTIRDHMFPEQAQQASPVQTPAPTQAQNSYSYSAGPSAEPGVRLLPPSHPRYRDRDRDREPRSSSAAPTSMAATIQVDRGKAGEFYRVINGKPLAEVLDVMEELLETTKIINPRLYDGVISKLTYG